MAFLFLYVLIIFTLLHILIRYRRIGRFVDKIPGPVALPFLGNMLSLMGSRENLWNTFRGFAAHYSIARLWNLTSAYVLIHDPDDVQIILTQKVNLDKNAIYEFMVPFLKTGLLTSGGEKWRQRRKLLNPSFHLNTMTKYIEITCEHAERFIAQIKSCGTESIQDLIPQTSDLTLKILCESLMGVNLDKLDNNVVKDFKKGISDAYHLIIYRSARPYIRNWMMKVLPLGKWQNNIIKIQDMFINKIIQERRDYINLIKDQDFENNESMNDNSFEGGKKMSCMLDLLLAEKDGLINAQGVREEVDVFMITGHDTTALSLAFLLILLAENKDIQNQARAEADKVFNECNSKLTISEIQKFEYIDRCVKEGLRLYPPISLFLRYMTTDLQLKKYIVPAGIDLSIQVYDIHRNPTYWPEPNKFDPDRFLPENVKKIHPFAYIPFSAGPRNCIGQKFAVLQLKYTVALILHNFYLEPVEITSDIKLELQVTLHPTHPIHVKFVSRNIN